MMTIVFPCKRCGHSNQVDGAMAGRRIECGRCLEEQVVPGAARRPPVPEPPAPLVVPLDDEEEAARPLPPPVSAASAPSGRPKAHRTPPRPGSPTRPRRVRRRRQAGDLMGSLVFCAMGLVGLAALGAWILTFFEDPPLKPFNCAAGGFTIQMPGEPIEKVHPVQTSLGTITDREYTVELRNGEYLAQFFDIPATVGFWHRGSLDDSVAGLVSSQQGTLQHKAPIRHGGYPGLEYRYTYRANGVEAVGQGRIIRIEDRYYNLAITGNEARAVSKTNAKFLDSFLVTRLPYSGPPELQHEAELRYRIALRTEQAQAALAAGRPEEAAAHYDEAARVDPRMTSYYLSMAAVTWLGARSDVKTHTRALAAAREAEATATDRPTDARSVSWHRNLGSVYLAAEEPAKALPHFEKALELATDDAERRLCEQNLSEARARATAGGAATRAEGAATL